MKHFFYFMLFQLFVIQSVNAQNDPNAPASVNYNFSSGLILAKVITEPAPLPKNWAEGTISGSIRDKNGAPIPKIIVKCRNKEVTTDENGDYRITGLRTGVHVISIRVAYQPQPAGDSGDYDTASGPSDHIGSPAADDNNLVYPRYPQVVINAANQNVVQNFVWRE
jgi:hypothetical protein